jgi:acyl carrier protein
VTEQIVENAVDGAEAERVDQILAIVREVLGRPELAADDEVMDHGGTSLSILRILTDTRKALSLNINPRDLGGVVTARSLARAAR